MMFGIRVPMPIVFGVLFVSSLARVDAAEPRVPGIVHKGRFIGFVPAHLKARRTTVSAAADISIDTVQQAEFVSEAADQRSKVVAHEFASPEAGDVLESPEAFCGEGMAGPPAHRLALAPCVAPFLWGRAEYLLWWTRGMEAPPLATTSSAAMNQAGVLGQPGTTILFGGEGLNDEARSGGRFTLGAWLDPWRRQGLEVAYVLLGAEASSFSASNDDLSILARPFFNVETNVQDARRIVFPGNVSGNLDIQTETDFQAFEALYRVSPCNAPCRHVNFVLGYRFAELEDGVRIHEFTEALAGPLVGTTFDLIDDFNTRNTFHGGELGIVVAGQKNACWSWEAGAKLALGSTTSRASVAGQTTTTTGAASASTQAGLLAQSTNIGAIEQSDFSTLSEFDIAVRRRLNCGVSLVFGYSILYWSDVARAGDQIDLGVNPSQIPPGMLAGPARPGFPFEQTGFWAQGLRFGVDFAY